MWLSILIPSIRPEGLSTYVNSLKRTAFDNASYEIVTNHDIGPTMSELNYRCYKESSGKWIMLANDDLIMETYGWDEAIKNFLPDDEIGLLWPNDMIFGSRLSCFPIVSRHVLEAVKYWPQPYKRYKIDDTLFHIFPSSRKQYLADVVMRHTNTHNGPTYDLGDGRKYPYEPTHMEHDDRLYEWQRERRELMAAKIRSML